MVQYLSSRTPALSFVWLKSIYFPVTFGVVSSVYSDPYFSNLNKHLYNKSFHLSDKTINKCNLYFSNTGGSFIEVKQTSSCWTMFCDRIQQISNDIPSRLVEYVDEATFLLSVAKCVITLLPKENTGSVELVFFERHVLSQFVHSLMEARQACCQKITKKYHNYHSFFSNAIRDLVMMQPTDTFTQALLHEIIGYLTIPWMADQTKFSDLRLPQEVFKKLAEISVQIRHRIPDDEAFTTTFLDESLISLIFGGFVKNVALKWRLIVAEKIWSIARILLKSGHQKWIEHIINSLPLLLHSHGNGSLPLVKEILEDILNSQNERLIIILSKVSGILICTLTKKTRLQNEIKGLKYVDNLVCSHCDRKQHKLISSQQPPFTLTSEQDMSIVSLLTKLIGYGDTDARLAILNMIIPMSNHIGFWESPLESSVNLWLSCYLEGDDGESTLHFVRHLNYLAAPAWIIEKIEIVNSGTNKMSKSCNDDSFKHSSTIEEMMSVENGPTKFNERHRVWTEICKSLQLLCNKAINSTTYDVQHVQLVESAVFGVVNIGLLNISSLEKDILNLLLDLYFSSSCHISTFCQADIMIKKMLVSHKTHACNRLAAQMCSTVNHNNLRKHQFVVKGANPTLRIFVTLYEGDNETTNKGKKGQKEKAFLTEQLDHLLPSIVLESCRAGPCQKEHETSALQYVAEELKINKKQLVGENLCYIFPHIVLHFKDKDELRKCMLFIGKETGTQFWDLVPSQRTSIIHELVTKLSKGKDRILIGLELIAKNDADGMKTYRASNGNMDNIKGVKGSRETVDLPKFMLPYLMGCLDYIDNRLSVHSTTMEDDIDFGIEMMRSLQHLIKIMGGNNIGCVKYKLLSTIKTASSWVSRHKKGNIVITETWETMIKTIDLEELCPIVGTILANLTVMYQNNDVSDTKKLLNLFRHLIVQNKAVFLENFTRLHFLPEYPEFIEFNQIIREANEITDNTEFKYVLAAIVDSTTNESIEAKFLALTKLLHVLKSNQGKVQGLILSSDQVNVSITRLINLLMSLIAISSEDDISIACIAGKCIGSLGAVDPGRLEIICDLNCDNIVGLNVYDDNFCYLLLSILTNAYLAALSSGSAEDAKKCSYSIQQSLRFYKIKQYVNNSKQCIMQNTSSLEAIVWSKLKDSSKEVLGQFFDSLYERVYSKPSYTLPIFKSTFGSTYKHWLSNWSTQLISKVMDKNVADVFKGCIPSVHCDIKVAQHLLPYILVTVISQSKDHAREVREEIEVILDENTTNQQMTQKDMNNFLFNEENEDGDWNSDNKGESYELKYNAVRMVFAILDHMNKWSKKRYSQLTQKMKPRDDPSDYTSKDLQFVSIKEFVDSIKPKTLAKVALESKSYARSLLYLEIHLRKDPGDLNACYFNLQTIYGALKESDYLAGLKKVKKGDLSMSEMIHHNQAMGNFQDAVACCESIGRYTKEQSSATKMGLGLKLCILQCYLELDRPQTAFELAKGYVRSNPEWAKRMKPLQLKAAQQLGQWADVKELLPEDESCLNSGSWEANLSGLLLKLHEQTFSGKSYAKLLNNSRQIEVSALSLSVKEQGAYTRCYENIVRLQILDEIESIASCMKVIKQGSDGKNIESAVVACENLFEEWKTRMNFSGSSLSSLEHVLQVRRNLLSILVNLIDAKHSNSNSKQGGQITKTNLSSLKLQVQAEVGENLLFSAKFARKENRLEKAFSILLEAEKFKHPELFIERSKLVWARQDCREAISILEKGIETHFPEYTFGFSRDKIVSIDDSKREICAKAKLLLARYVDEAASYAPGTIIKYYEEARAMSKKSEEANYASATFFDKIIGKNYEAKDLDTRGSVVRHIIQLYGNSLTHGCDHLDQSLPRMLSLWFDFGSRYEENLKYGAKGDHPKASERLKVIEDMGKHLKRINELMSLFVNKYKNTPYLLLAALPQLISRICHSHGDIYKVLRTMLITAFSNYPQQVIWHVIPLLKSSYAVRSSRGQEVIDQIKAKCPHLNKIIDDGLLLSDKLLKLCDEKSTASGNDRVGVVNLNQLMPSLLKLINNSNFSKIIMPSNYNMTMRLPTKQVGMLNHDAFSSTSLVYFEKVEENVTIMRSLVKPKKLDFWGSDGKKYSFLCKPKDDLRRDCRLLEFNNLLNKLFMKDPECRKRNLHIRTYTVIPLNETNGIIEWVNNVVPFRTIITKLYKEKLGKNYMRPQEINDYTCNPGEVQKNKKNYDYLLKRHTPAVFGEWFVNNFPDPQAWFMARMSYTRTTAVMSMVCYLIGLGDRHCENIMYDETNGDTLHVDLNCLFNKGKLNTSINMT